MSKFANEANVEYNKQITSKNELAFQVLIRI